MKADTGIDCHEILRYPGKRGIEVVIKVKKGAVITSNRAMDEVMRKISGSRTRWK